MSHMSNCIHEPFRSPCFFDRVPHAYLRRSRAFGWICWICMPVYGELISPELPLRRPQHQSNTDFFQQNNRSCRDLFDPAIRFLLPSETVHGSAPLPSNTYFVLRRRCVFLSHTPTPNESFLNDVLPWTPCPTTKMSDRR